MPSDQNLRQSKNNFRCYWRTLRILEEAFEPLRDSSSKQPASEPHEEDGIVDIEPDEDNDALDDEFLNKLIRSRDFFGLVDAYSGALTISCSSNLRFF